MVTYSDSLIVNSTRFSNLLLETSNMICKQIEEQTEVLVKTISESNVNDNYFKFISNDTLFTTILTISIFSIGLLINWITKKLEQNKHNRNISRFTKINLDEIVNHDFKQLAKEYLDYSDSIIPDENLPKLPPKIETSNIENIINLNSLEVYTSLSRNLNILNILNFADFLCKLLYESKEYRNRIIEKIEIQEERLEEHLNSFTNYLTIFCNIQNLTLKNEKKLQELSNILLEKQFSNLPRNITLTLYIEEYVNPIKDFIKKHKSIKRNYDIKNVSDKIDSLHRLLSKNKSIAINVKEIYSGYSKQIIEIIDNIKLEMSKINWR